MVGHSLSYWPFWERGRLVALSFASRAWIEARGLPAICAALGNSLRVSGIGRLAGRVVFPIWLRWRPESGCPESLRLGDLLLPTGLGKIASPTQAGAPSFVLAASSRGS